jgi:hypothetical protein
MVELQTPTSAPPVSDDRPRSKAELATQSPNLPRRQAESATDELKPVEQGRTEQDHEPWMWVSALSVGVAVLYIVIRTFL